MSVIVSSSSSSSSLRGESHYFLLSFILFSSRHHLFRTNRIIFNEKALNAANTLHHLGWCDLFVFLFRFCFICIGGSRIGPRPGSRSMDGTEIQCMPSLTHSFTHSFTARHRRPTAHHFSDAVVGKATLKNPVRCQKREEVLYWMSFTFLPQPFKQPESTCAPSGNLY